MTHGDWILLGAALFMVLPLWLSTRRMRARAHKRRLAEKLVEAKAQVREANGLREEPVLIEHEPERDPEHKPEAEAAPPKGEPTSNLGVVDVAKGQRFQLQEHRGDEGLWTLVRRIDRKGRPVGAPDVRPGSLALVSRELLP